MGPDRDGAVFAVSQPQARQTRARYEPRLVDLRANSDDDQIGHLAASRISRRAAVLPALIVVGALTALSAHARDYAKGASPASGPTLVRLGEALFHTKLLSRNADIACASCHQSDQAFADGLPRARGVAGSVGARNTPSLLPLHAYTRFSWDGRNTELAKQVIEPFFSPVEHGLDGERDLFLRIRQAPELASHYRAAYPKAPFTLELLGAALAVYLDGLAIPAASLAEVPTPTSDVGRTGERLFRELGCANCHIPERGFTDSTFHVGQSAAQPSPVKVPSDAQFAAMNRARLRTHTHRYRHLAADADRAALGAFVTTRDPADVGKYRTPSLIAVVLTAPYFHDGSTPGLATAITREAQLRANRPLSEGDVQALIEYLRAATSH